MLKMLTKPTVTKFDRVMGGIPGTLEMAQKPLNEKGALAYMQWKSEYHKVPPRLGYGEYTQARLVVRWDDQCGNGYNNLTIRVETNRGDWTNDSGLVSGMFPGFTEMLKWDGLVSTCTEHLKVNFSYLAYDADCWGNRPGLPRQARNKDGLMWRLGVVQSEAITKAYGEYKGETTVHTVGSALKCCPREDLPPVPTLAWFPVYHEGEGGKCGKGREWDLASRSACWHDIKTEELMHLDQDGLKAAIEAQYPTILKKAMADFAAVGLPWDIESALWPTAS